LAETLLPLPGSPSIRRLKRPRVTTVVMTSAIRVQCRLGTIYISSHRIGYDCSPGGCDELTARSPIRAFCILHRHTVVADPSSPWCKFGFVNRKS
jgi:hypothetical protein